MKRSLIIAGVGLAFLLAWFGWQRPRMPASPTLQEKRLPAARLERTPRQHPPEKTKTGAPPRAAWSSVESGDPKQLMANLRAIGCPEQTIRDIVALRICHSYSERIEELQSEAERAWDYTRDRNPLEYRKGRWKEEELKLARDRELESILGISVAQLREQVLGWSLEQSNEFLSPEKRARVRELSLRYQQLIEQARAGVAHWHPDTAVEAKVRELDAQKRVELANLLTAQELEELDVRASPAALYVLRNLPQAGSEAEFRQMVRAVQEVGIEEPKVNPLHRFGVSFDLSESDTDEADRTQAEREALLTLRLKGILGESGLAELERAQQARRGKTQ